MSQSNIWLYILTPSPYGHSPYILLRKTQGERLRRIPFSFLFRFYMWNPVRLRDTAGGEDKHEQSPLIIDWAVLAGWTFLVFKIKKAVNRKINSLMQYPKGDLNPHSCNSQRILSPSCLPFHHSSILSKKERKTRLELATLTLARLCSTNWAISAFFQRVQR